MYELSAVVILEFLEILQPTAVFPNTGNAVS